MGGGKAVGADDMPAEFYTKAGTDTLPNLWVPILVALYNAVLHEGRLPAEWLQVILCMLHKKGQVTDPANYRSLGISTVILRIFSGILACRLSAYMDDHPHILLDSQFAFRRGLSTEHAHVAVSTCLESALSNKHSIAVIQLDVAKAFDTVDRDKLWAALKLENLPEGFVQLLQELLSECTIYS